MMAREDWKPMSVKYDPLKAGSIDGTDTEPHDRAVVRALNAKYKPNKSVQGNPEKTIFVGRLNLDTTEETLNEAFSYFGEIVNIRLVRDIVTGFSKRYAFIEYASVHESARAYREAHKMEIDQHEILVDYEHSHNMEGWVPRRLGGGFAGKKEAGQLRFGCRDRPFSKPIILNKTGSNHRYGNDRDNIINRDRKYDRERSYDRKDRDYTKSDSDFYERDRDGAYGKRDRDYGRDRNYVRSDRNRDYSRDSKRERDYARSDRRDRDYDKSTDKKDNKLQDEKDPF